MSNLPSDTGSGKHRSISTISELIGVSCDTLHEIARDFSEILPGKVLGRIHVYDDAIVERFRKIADLLKQGCSREVIISAICGGKTLEDRAAEEMKRFGIENKPATKQSKQTQKKQTETPNTQTEEEILCAIHSIDQKITAMDQRSAAIRDSSENNFKQIMDAISTLNRNLESLKSECNTLWNQVAELEEYLQKQAEENKPFWKRFHKTKK